MTDEFHIEEHIIVAFKELNKLRDGFMAIPESEDKQFSENHFERIVELYAILNICIEKLGLEVSDLQKGDELKVIEFLFENIFSQLVSGYELASHRISQHKIDKAFTNAKSILDEIELKINGLNLENSSVLKLTGPQRAHIQPKVSELREVIKKDGNLAEEHRARLLVKVNLLQTELNKETSDYFRIRVRIIDFSEAASEVGKNLKPLTDRAKEIADLFKYSKRENIQIGKDEPPKQIEDKTGENEDD